MTVGQRDFAHLVSVGSICCRGAPPHLGGPGRQTIPGVALLLCTCVHDDTWADRDFAHLVSVGSIWCRGTPFGPGGPGRQTVSG